MSEPEQQPGMRRRADKLRFIAWANLLLCMGVGVFVDFGDAALKWSAAAIWSVLLLAVCYTRAAQMDRHGPVQRKPLSVQRQQGSERP